MKTCKESLAILVVSRVTNQIDFELFAIAQFVAFIGRGPGGSLCHDFFAVLRLAVPVFLAVDFLATDVLRFAGFFLLLLFLAFAGTAPPHSTSPFLACRR
jgi:hypothetical protein